MDTRVNINIPKALFQEGQRLVDNGFFSNFSELVREGLRKEIMEYEHKVVLSEDEKKLFALLKMADERGLLLNENEMKKHGLEI